MNELPSVYDQVRMPDGSRRRFLTRAAAFAVAPLAVGLLGHQARATGPVMPPLHRLDQYVPQVGSSFRAMDAGEGLALTLVKAEALKYHHAGVMEQFSLCFIPSNGQPLESRIYHLQHAELGHLEIFISPIGPAGTTQWGEAIFNFTCPAAATLS